MDKTRLIILIGIGMILFVHFFPPLTKSIFHDPIKSIFWGIILILGACWFVYETAGNPLHELALIRHGQTTKGFIIDTFEDVGETDYGETIWHSYIVYEYTLSDGRSFKGREKWAGRLKEDIQNLTEPYPIEVEYVSDKPNISRIKGSGCQSIFELLWRKIGLGSILLIAFCSIGFVILRNGVRDFKKLTRIQKAEEP